ncbi:MAG: cytochrome c3 family protein [Desulfovibrionaceae bacterium]
MQKRYLSIAVFIGCMALVALVGYVIPSPTAAIPTRILLDNAGGKVVFDHKVHAAEYKIECQTCHHENTTPQQDVLPCGTCHGIAFDESFKQNHTAQITSLPACVTCHHMELKPAQWGHNEHSKDFGVDCRQCHHKDTGIEAEPQNCASCHEKTGDKSMPSLRSAVHSKCASCHQDLFDKKVQGCASCHTKVNMRTVLNDTGKAPIDPTFAQCQSCHVGQKTADLIPNRMAAFHGSCIKCHEKLGKGPFGKDQCNQCHTK